MKNAELYRRLADFRNTQKISSKGALSTIVHVTRFARENGLPLSESQLVTPGTGQVHGLGRAAVQRILGEYGIRTVLAEEGGRTSRGSLGNMRSYVVFLNSLHIKDHSTIDQIEAWWVARIREFFLSKPFRMRFDAAKSIQALIQDLLAQAKKRQQEQTGTMIQGAMLQHLIGAKLELALPEIMVDHNGFSVSDNSSNRSGDFVIDDSVIHITTAPGEAVIRKCQSNIESGIKPIILTLSEGVVIATGLARNAGLAGRIDILDAEQFLTANLHELSLFQSAARRTTLMRLIEVYNRIVEENETDLSLKIELG